jgi:hypothetical protein
MAKRGKILLKKPIKALIIYGSSKIDLLSQEKRLEKYKEEKIVKWLVCPLDNLRRYS